MYSRNDDEANETLLRRDSRMSMNSINLTSPRLGGEVDHERSPRLGQQAASVAGGRLAKVGRKLAARPFWLLCLLPLLLIGHRLFFLPTAIFACPSPFTPLQPSQSPSTPPSSSSSPYTALSSRNPTFSLSISHDPSTCNSFTLRIRRNDEARCAHMESSVDPAPEDEQTSKWIRENIGPDVFSVQVEGAERRMEDVPTVYSGGCQYEFSFRLRNAGLVWLSAEWLFEDYEGFKEMEDMLYGRPTPKLLKYPLLDPIELDLSSSSTSCTPYSPPPLGASTDRLSFSGTQHSSSHDDIRSTLPDCSTVRSPLSGSYIPNSPYSLRNPAAMLPPSLQASNRLSPAGLLTWVPSSCTFSHAGQRFQDHTPCKAKPHKALLIGDSHTRAVYDIIKWRMQGNNRIALDSVKELEKNSTAGELSLFFKWDPFMRDQPLTCDYFDRFDSITISTGSHQACFMCQTTQHFVAHLTSVLSALPTLLRTCASRSTLPKLVLMTMPTFPPVVGNIDCRTGPRIAYWNELAATLAQEQGDWDVVEIGAYSRPVQDDMRLFDATHYLRTDAADPIVDEVIERLGFCSSQ